MSASPARRFAAPLVRFGAVAMLFVAGACSGNPSPAIDADAASSSPATDAGAIVDAATPPVADAGAGSDAASGRCAAGSRTGAAGATDGLVTAGGTKLNVRTPAGYDPTTASPLLVVYAPSGGTASFIETATGLTADASKAGMIVAYVDTVSPADTTKVKDVATVPNQLAATWCIDRSRVYLTGSSDGGGVIYTIVLNHFMVPEPAAIAPFAAVASKNTLAKATCLAPPMPAMVMHNAEDMVFPMYGRAARDFWIACNTCGAPKTLPDGCLAYEGCAAGAEVRYCEGPGGHGRWPALNGAMLAFFARFERP